MALADMFSNSLISPVLNWAKQQNIPQAAGSLLAAYAIPALAGGLIRKPHRGQVQMMLAQPLLNQAFNYLQRPQQVRDLITKQQIADQGLTAVAPTPGATPVMTWEGTPLFKPGTVADRYPDKFRPSLLPKGMSGIRPYDQEMNMEPSSARQIPDVPLSLQILGEQPDTSQARIALAALLGKQELREEETARYQRSQQQMEAVGAGNDDLVKVPGVSKGGYYTPKYEQKRGSSSRPLVLSPGAIAIDPSTQKEIGRGLPKAPPKETLSDAKLQALRYYQRTGQAPPGFTEEELKNSVGMNRGTQLQDTSNMLDLRDLNKEAAKLKESLTPFLPLLAKYPDGNIPTAELSRAQSDITENNHPFLMIRDAAPLLAAQARLAEIEQEKQELLQPRGKQRGTSAAPASFSDFYKSLKQ